MKPTYNLFYCFNYMSMIIGVLSCHRPVIDIYEYVTSYKPGSLEGICPVWEQPTTSRTSSSVSSTTTQSSLTQSLVATVEQYIMF